MESASSGSWPLVGSNSDLGSLPQRFASLCAGEVCWHGSNKCYISSTDCIQHDVADYVLTNQRLLRMSEYCRANSAT